MKTISPATTAVRPALLRRRRSRLASLIAAGALAFGYPVIGLGYPSIAGAQPNNGGGPGGSGEWDIGAYDYCMAHPEPGTVGSIEAQLDHHRWCCESTGGVWGSGDNGCHAPPGEASAPLGPGGPQQVTPPSGVKAPPLPVNPTAPVNPGSFG